MIPGHWQFIILLIVIIFVLGPSIMRLLHRIIPTDDRNNRHPNSKNNSLRCSIECPHCGEKNPQGAKFCCACGKPMEFIDV